MPPYLGERWRGSECRATTCFSLTQDLVTHLTVNLIPSLSILSPGRVGVGVGGCRDQVQSPRCSVDKDDGGLHPISETSGHMLMKAVCNGLWRFRSQRTFCPARHSFWCRFCPNHILLHPIPNSFLTMSFFCVSCHTYFHHYVITFSSRLLSISISLLPLFHNYLLSSLVCFGIFRRSVADVVHQSLAATEDQQQQQQ